MAQADKNKIRPPRWADRFLEWYCHPSLLEEIQGDNYEIFYRQAASHPIKAKIAYSWNVVRFFRCRNIRKSNFITNANTTIMIGSYFKTGFRNIIRNFTPSAINITGLSVALACAVLVFLLTDSYYNLDQWHEKSNRIYEVISDVREGNETREFASSPYLLARHLEENANIEMATHFRKGNVSVRVGELVFPEVVTYADATFMQTFSFRTLSGNRNCLSDPRYILLSEKKALTYFGNTQVIGQTISIKFNENFKKEFIVGGILENTPNNSSMIFNFLLSVEIWEQLAPSRAGNWSDMSVSTFIVLKEKSLPEQIKSSLDIYQKNHNTNNPTRPVTGTKLIPLAEVATNSYQYVDALSWSNHPSAFIALSIMATFLVLVACFNYVNVAVASVSTRLKEIGVRKVIGSTKKDIVHQFLIENFIVCALAMLLGCLLAYLLLIPAWNTLYDVKIEFTFSSWQMIVICIGGLLLFVATLSGSYPALYVSSFNAVKILKGKEKFGSKSSFSKALLGIQFALSFTSLVACQVFMWASYHFENKDWGYNQQQTIAIPVQSTEQYLKLRDKLSSKPNVLSVAGTSQHIGKMGVTSIIQHGAQEINAMHFHVGYGYPETMNLRLLSGRFFNEQSATDKHEAVLVNHNFVKTMGWKSGLNQSFMLDSVKRYVIGIVEDFYFNDFYSTMEPAIITLAPESTFTVMAVKADAGYVNEVHEFIKQSWKEVAPEDPYYGYLQSEVFDSFLQGNKANNKVLYFISAISILLIAMGLYGLVSYNLTRRLKEFSIRKVFGANTLSLFGLMNKDYVWIVLSAFFIGAPFGAYLMTMLIKSIYPEHVPQTPWPYLTAIGVMLLIVLITVGSQLSKVLHQNPTNHLRSE